MASTQQLAAGYISDGDLLESEAQTAFEQIVSLIKELCGGTADNAKINLASDAFGILSDVSTYVIDSEGGSGADTLKWISGTARDGQLIAVRPYNAGRAQTIFNGAGGAGQILTKNGQNFTLSKTGQFAILKYVAGSPGYWEEWLRDETARIDQLLGARSASSVSVSSSQITVDRGRHTVTSGTTTNIDQALGIDTFDHDGNLLILSLADTTYTRTLRHNQGTTGKFNLLGGANIAMVADAYYCFSKNGTTWDHLFTIFSSAKLGASANAQSLLFGDGAGGWTAFDASGITAGYVFQKKATAPYFEFAANSSNSKRTPSAKSTNFTMTADSHGTFHLITTSGSDITVTVGASPADGTCYHEVIHSGTNKAIYTANGAEVFYFGDHTDTVLHVVPGAAPVTLVAVSGGWYVC